MKVIFDVNILISYGIGKHLAVLENYLMQKDIEVWYNDELIDEYLEVVSRPHISKLISKQKELFTISLFKEHGMELLNRGNISYVYPKIIDPNEDLKDIYLLKLCINIKADFLVTGDKWLLQLRNYGKTAIISFKEFEKLNLLTQ